MIFLLLWMLTAIIGLPAHANGKALPPVWEPRRVALVVGINHFEDAAVGDLQFAVKDATDMKGALDQYADFDVTLVTGTVTKPQLLQAIRAVTATLQPRDSLIVYIATHGTLRELGGASTLYLLTSDSHLSDVLASAVPVATLHDVLADVHVASAVLILDTCYNGRGRSRLPESEERHVRSVGVADPVHVAPGRTEMRLYAAEVNQAAGEDKTLQNGVYTHYLVEAIVGGSRADLDGDGQVDISEAHLWAVSNTIRFTQGRQIPWDETRRSGQGVPLVLVGEDLQGSRAQKAIIVGQERLPGAEIRLDGALLTRGAIDPGGYNIEILVDERVVVRRRIRVSAGERVSVTDLADDKMAWGLLAGVQGGASSHVSPLFIDVGGRLGRHAGVGLELHALTGLGTPSNPADESLFSAIAPTGLIVLTPGWTHGEKVQAGFWTGPGIAWRRPIHDSMEGGAAWSSAFTLAVPRPTVYPRMTLGVALVYTEEADSNYPITPIAWAGLQLGWTSRSAK